MKVNGGRDEWKQVGNCEQEKLVEKIKLEENESI